MKTTNQLLFAFAILLMLPTSSIFSQDEPVRPQYVVATTLHWNMDNEDFDMAEWEAVEKEYLDKVTLKNEHVMTSGYYLHRYTEDNTELLFVRTFGSWEAIDKATDRNTELEKAAWPDEAAAKAYFKKRNAYYDAEHSDEIYAPLAGAKLISEKPTKDLILYVRKSQFAFPEDGSMEEFDKLRMGWIENVVNKNNLVKGYYPNVHAWGTGRTMFTEAFYFDSMADIEDSQEKGNELAKAAWPDENTRKERGEKMAKYFTGVHGDYIYTMVHSLRK